MIPKFFGPRFKAARQREDKLMDVSKILAELRAERAQLEEAILSLERLARGRGKRRGRPPAWLSPDRNNNVPGEFPAAEAPRRRGRPPGSKNKVITASATTAVA
jgi:hypothetical protein